MTLSISPEEILDAYEKTGLKPMREGWTVIRRGQAIVDGGLACGCPLLTLVVAKDPTLVPWIAEINDAILASCADPSCEYKPVVPPPMEFEPGLMSPIDSLSEIAGKVALRRLKRVYGDSYVTGVLTGIDSPGCLPTWPNKDGKADYGRGTADGRKIWLAVYEKFNHVCALTY